MEYFFTPEERLPAGVGFKLFGWEHLCWLAISLALAVIICSIYLRCVQKWRRRIRICVGSAILACELLKSGNLMIQGTFGIYYLPLHLCGLAVFLSFIHALKPGNMLGNLLYSTCMPGALFALLFPDWTVFPAFSFHSIVGFTVHALIVVYPLMQVLTKDIRPNIKLLPRCLGILLCMAIPIYIFDLAFNTNYMFLIQAAPGSPLEWFVPFFGSRGYIIGYIPMIATVWLLLYLPFISGSDSQS